MECRDRLENYLRENQVRFEEHHHPRAVSAQEVAASEHVPGRMLAKTVMVLADGEMVMLRRRLSGFDSRSQIEAVTQRARIVQAESRRAELSLVWADQRLHVLAERVK